MIGWGNTIGELWAEDRMCSDDLEMKFKYRISGERYGSICTEVLKKYRNPEIKGHFFSEDVIWFRIAKDYDKTYFNKSVRVYITQEDSVTVNSKE